MPYPAKDSRVVPGGPALTHRPAGPPGEESFEHPELFRGSDQWHEHWHPDRAPVNWRADPSRLREQAELWEVFRECIRRALAR